MTNRRTTSFFSAAAATAESLAVQALFQLFRTIPVAVRGRLGELLGRAVGPLLGRDFRTATLQLERFLGASEPRRLAKGVFGHFGRMVAECVNVTPLLARATLTINDEALVERVRTDGRGTLALTAHLGNWDLLAAFLHRRGLSITTVARKARRPSAHRILEQLRAEYGLHCIWRSDRDAPLRIRETLRNGGILAALIDQDTRVKSAFGEFFGAPAPVPTSLLNLARRMDARIVHAFILRTGQYSFHLDVQEYPADLSEAELLRQYHRALEQHIRRYPEQWVWFHRRWRTHPSGERMPGREYHRWLQEGIRGPAQPPAAEITAASEETIAPDGRKADSN